MASAAILLGTLNGLTIQDHISAAQSSAHVPTYEVDPAWPKSLPNRWLVGALAGVAVDKKDHVWIVHRPATLQPNETR